MLAKYGESSMFQPFIRMNLQHCDLPLRLCRCSSRSVEQNFQKRTNGKSEKWRNGNDDVSVEEARK